jgi:dsDNA-specific endonuclease/ATPase MutS2
MPFRDLIKNWFGDWIPPESRSSRIRPYTDVTVEGDESKEVDPFNPFPEPIAIEIRDVFDLHTIAPRDVGRVVEAYLDEARRKGFRSVRIIHGKGVGVQREIVRGILSRTEFIEDWTDAPPDAGGWGATIARLKVKGD